MNQNFRKLYLPYFRSIYDIGIFQLANFFIVSGTVFLFKQLAMILIRSSGREAISTGDFMFLFTTWQGPLLLAIGLIILTLYVAFDLNSQILFSESLLKGKPEMKNSLINGFLSIRDFLTPDGIGIILYISLIAPIVGFGFTISLTDSLYVPSFISSVIDSVPAYKLLYNIFIIAFIALGVLNIFTLHGILLSGKRSCDADNESRKLIKENWKDFIRSNLLFALRFGVIFVADFFITGIIPALLVTVIFTNKTHQVIAYYFILFSMLVTMFLIGSYFKSFYMIKMTQLYHRYRGEDDSFKIGPNKKQVIISLINITLLFAILFGVSILVSTNFEQIFSTQVKTQIISHRAGGVEAPENTIAGIEKAIEYGAAGAEIDIQRTKDGYYIINHDGNFARLCSSNGKPEELTLEEIKALTIRDPLFPDQEEKVATLEEMLEASKDRIILFIELKGNTADQQMADDAVKIVKEAGMEDQCVLISLKYPLIDYIERNYPEMDTAYLTFASFGKTANLNCDYIGLEEEATNTSTIDAIHDTGRKVLVWTPNSEYSIRKFLLSKADYIITDQVSLAKKTTKELNERKDIEVLIDLFFIN